MVDTRPPVPQGTEIAAAGNPTFTGSTPTNVYTSLAQGLQAQLDEAIASNKLNVARSQSVQQYAPQASQNIMAVRDLGQRVAGEAPSALLRGAADIGSAYATTAQEAAQAASSKNVLDIYAQLLNVQQAKQDYEMEKYKTIQETGIDPETGAAVSSSQISDDTVVEGYIDQLKTGAIKLSNVPTEIRDRVVNTMKRKGVNLADEQKKYKGKEVKGLLANVRDAYYLDPEQSNDDLAKGRIFGGVANIKAMLGLDDRVSTYNDLRKGIAASLKGLVGDTGTLTDADIERIVGLLPTAQSTAGEAKQKWEDINAILESKYNISLDEPDEAPGTTRMIGPDGNEYDVPNEQVKAFEADGGRRK